MIFNDMLTLSIRNIKANKKRVKKIIVGFICVFVIMSCMIAVCFFYADYYNQFERKYASNCYFYSQLEYEYPNADEVSQFRNIGIDGQAIIIGDVSIYIDDVCFDEKKYFEFNREKYQTYTNSNSKLDILIYKKEYNIFPKLLYGDSVKITGNLPTNSGEIMIDDYLMKVFGVGSSLEELIGKTVTICYDKETVISDYVISGILEAYELEKREEDSIHDFHFEHIYINPKSDDAFQCIGGTKRFYFDNYKKLISNYKYSEQILSLAIDEDEYENAEFKLSEKGMEICVIEWLMKIIGKIFLVLIIIIILVILFSLIYVIQFYLNRNKKYNKMLDVIGMKKKNRIIIFNFEMNILISVSIVIAVYIVCIFMMIFYYVTNKLLSVGYTPSICASVVSVFSSYLLANIYVNLVYYIYYKNKAKQQ